nr:redox-sensitive transcriptional activator SoxR [uncultured Cohaesibacter sp.]
MKKNDILSIGLLSERTGIAISAIRYYEQEGLVHPARNAGGQRRFLRSDIRRLSFIRLAQQFGLTLPQIRAELSRLPNHRTPTARDWKRISGGFRDHLTEQIETLTQLRDNLDSCIGCGCLSLDKCKLYNKDDAAAKLGAGPRYVMGNSASDVAGQPNQSEEN